MGFKIRNEKKYQENSETESKIYHLLQKSTANWPDLKIEN